MYLIFDLPYFKFYSLAIKNTAPWKQLVLLMFVISLKKKYVNRGAWVDYMNLRKCWKRWHEFGHVFIQLSSRFGNIYIVKEFSIPEGRFIVAIVLFYVLICDVEVFSQVLIPGQNALLTT